MEALRTGDTCGLEALKEADLINFAKGSTCYHGRRNRCHDCRNALTAERYAESAEVRARVRSTSIRRDYGVEPEIYLERLGPSSSCQCSGRTDRGLVYDHVHDDAVAFRGVLCNPCNKAIGALGDNIAGVQSALEYLKESGRRKEAGDPHYQDLEK